MRSESWTYQREDDPHPNLRLLRRCDDDLKFHREFDAFLRCARLEPAEIARRGRRAFVLMSADHTTGSGLPVDGRIAPDTATVVINTVERAELGPEHAALDELLK